MFSMPVICTLQVAFYDVDVMSLAERQREEARNERQQRQREEKLSKVLTEISGEYGDPQCNRVSTDTHNAMGE